LNLFSKIITPDSDHNESNFESEMYEDYEELNPEEETQLIQDEEMVPDQANNDQVKEQNRILALIDYIYYLDYYAGL
jgi:hypothetical protein